MDKYKNGSMNKYIVAGGRDFYDYKGLEEVLNRFPIDIVVCGMARGADSLGLQYAKEYKIGIRKFPADWDLYGRRAGPLRNIQMAEYADELIAFWDGKSKGTKHMIDYMHKLGKPVHIVGY